MATYEELPVSWRGVHQLTNTAWDVLSSSASEFVFLHSAQLAGSGLRRQKIKSGDTVCNGLHIGIIQIDEGDDVTLWSIKRANSERNPKIAPP